MWPWKPRVGRSLGKGKEAGSLPFETMPAPSTLYFPITQHQGKPAIPVVKRRDKVEVGTLLAKADGAFSSSIHSSVSGEVRAIESIVHPWGTWTEAIVVENDGLHTPAPTDLQRQKEVQNPEEMSPTSIMSVIAAAGIVGMGGAMFPTALKLAPSRPIDTLIVNGCECEPILACDHRTLLERSDALVYGIRALRHAIGAEKIIVAIEANKPDAITLYRELGKALDLFEVAQLPTRYPYGAERVLIPAVTGRRIPYGEYPDSVGVIVQNVATVAAVADALKDGLPLIRRPLTVAGKAVSRTANVIVPLGTPVSHVLHSIGLNTEPGRLILGGPMMGTAIPTGDVPVIKGTSGIVAQTTDEIHHFRASACLHCGRCVDACPAGLMPTQLARLSSHGRFDEADRLGVRDCMECGLCSFQCPAELPLTQLIRLAKQEIRQKEAEELARIHTDPA